MTNQSQEEFFVEEEKKNEINDWINFELNKTNRFLMILQNKNPEERKEESFLSNSYDFKELDFNSVEK